MNENPGETMFCANHPTRQTLLRCNRCQKPICSECAVLTPTGYRCKDCVRGIQKRFDNARPIDLPLAAVFTLILSFGGSFVARILGFFTIFVAPILGVIIVEVVRRIVHQRRSQNLFLVTAGAAAVGSLPLLILGIMNLFGIYFFGLNIGGWLTLIWQGLFTFLITSTVYYRMSGIQL
jgi:hypothetical protein